jgi:ATP-dependent DNA helicase RecG
MVGSVESGAGSGQRPGGTSQKSSQKSSQKIIELMQRDPEVTIVELALVVGVTDRAIKKQIEKLKGLGRIRRIGPDKGGHWEVVE